MTNQKTISDTRMQESTPKQIREFTPFLLIGVFVFAFLIPLHSAYSFEGGDGTAANPYRIATCEQLQDLDLRIGHQFDTDHYVLTDDIDCSGTSTWNEGKGFKPIGKSHPGTFRGSLDGQGHRITGLYINRPEESTVGLFGYTSEASISNITLAGVNVTGERGVGGLIGTGSHSQVTNSRVSGTITAKYRGG
ncbi:MAG: hypothetical protein WDZ79_01610, partial [Candidatus Paceibacterota bacterium]